MALQIIREAITDVVKRGATRAIYAKQNDVNSRFLNVRIQEEGKDVPVVSTSTVLLNVARSDNTTNIFYGTVNEDGTVRIPLAPWMLELEGTLACDISIIEEGSDVAKLTTMQFNIYVEAAVNPDNSFIESEDYSVIVDLLDRTEAAEQAASSAAQAATTSALKASAAASNAEFLKSTCENSVQDLEDIKEELARGGYVQGIREQNHGVIFRFWIGTSEEYNTLDIKPQNTYVIFTDDNSMQDLKVSVGHANKVLFETSDDYYAYENSVTIDTPGLSNYSIIKIMDSWGNVHVLTRISATRFKGSEFIRTATDGSDSVIILMLDLTCDSDHVFYRSLADDPDSCTATQIATNYGEKGLGDSWSFSYTNIGISKIMGVI